MRRLFYDQLLDFTKSAAKTYYEMLRKVGIETLNPLDLAGPRLLTLVNIAKQNIRDPKVAWIASLWAASYYLLPRAHVFVFEGCLTDDIRESRIPDQVSWDMFKAPFKNLFIDFADGGFDMVLGEGKTPRRLSGVLISEIDPNLLNDIRQRMLDFYSKIEGGGRKIEPLTESTFLFQFWHKKSGAESLGCITRAFRECEIPEVLKTFKDREGLKALMIGHPEEEPDLAPSQGELLFAQTEAMSLAMKMLCYLTCSNVKYYWGDREFPREWNKKRKGKYSKFRFTRVVHNRKVNLNVPESDDKRASPRRHHVRGSWHFPQVGPCAGKKIWQIPYWRGVDLGEEIATKIYIAQQEDPS